jgi:CRISPR-associated protein Cmr3
MKAFALTPVDAWFFRDGRPYNEKETNQSDVSSVFPPPARTLSGACRAALARANGWSGSGRWAPELNDALGNGPDELGALQFTGPFLVKDSQALWPMPRHVLGRIQSCWAPSTFLLPDKSPCHCDSGQINLPVIALPPDGGRDGLKPADTAWITVPALSMLLAGKLPAATEIFTPAELWALEPRVGLHRNESTLNTGEGALYSPAYVRLQRGVALGMAFGLPSGLKPELPSIFPFGGESRLAQCDPWPHFPLPNPLPYDSFKPDGQGCICFTATLLTPGGFQTPELSGAKVISACVGKPQFIGGWDSLRREPLPLQPFAPAGSVWFCTVSAADFPAIYARHGKHVGPHAAHGFGQLVIGHWPSPITLTQ